MAVSAPPSSSPHLCPHLFLRSKGSGRGVGCDDRFQGHGCCLPVAFRPGNLLWPKNYKLESPCLLVGLCVKGNFGRSRIHCRYQNFQMDAKSTVFGHDKSNKPTTAWQLDQWIHSSVSEIVKNIRQTPFLVHIYPEPDDGVIDGSDPSSSSPPFISNPARLVFEEASSATWPHITQRWKNSNSSPGGVILVRQLRGTEDDSGSDKFLDSSTKLWGLLVQGKGLTCPVCYVLKTSQVQCCFGFCTHFCLSKVECSVDNVCRDPAHTNNLLLQRQSPN